MSEEEEETLISTTKGTFIPPPSLPEEESVLRGAGTSRDVFFGETSPFIDTSDSTQKTSHFSHGDKINKINIEF